MTAQDDFTHSGKYCVGCNAKLITQRAWNQLGRNERRYMRANGFQRQFVGQACSKVSCQDVWRARMVAPGASNG